MHNNLEVIPAIILGGRLVILILAAMAVLGWYKRGLMWFFTPFNYRRRLGYGRPRRPLRYRR